MECNNNLDYNDVVIFKVSFPKQSAHGDNDIGYIGVYCGVYLWYIVYRDGIMLDVNDIYTIV